jgi:uncharacterized OsmC-like protein
MARRIDPAGLVGHARGEIELDGKVLVLKRIHVTYTGFEITEDERETLRRVVATHAQGCPVARSLEGAIEITTAVDDL